MQGAGDLCGDTGAARRGGAALQEISGAVRQDWLRERKRAHDVLCDVPQWRGWAWD